MEKALTHLTEAAAVQVTRVNTLRAARCSTCSHVSWPTTVYCPDGCGLTMEATSIQARGIVYASTVLHVAHDVFGSSYQVAYVDLPDGPRVFGHVRSLQPIAIGTSVDVTVGTRATPSGVTTQVATFTPTEMRQAAR